MIIHPRYRAYLMTLVMESLRDMYYRDGKDYGKLLASVTMDVRGFLLADGNTDEALDRAGVDESTISALVSELLHDKLVTYHTTSRDAGFFGNRKIISYFYKLTEEGLQHTKSMTAPPKIKIEMNGDMFVDSVDRVSVAGDAYVQRVEKLVRADEDIRVFIEETRRLNFQSVRLLQDHVYRVLEENARLRSKVESRGWSLLEFALATAKFLLP